jgi:hypothetical protein
MKVNQFTRSNGYDSTLRIKKTQVKIKKTQVKAYGKGFKRL